MEEIKSEMEMIQAFLIHADKTMNGDGPTAVWVAQVREIAYCIEDVIDEFTSFVGENMSFGFWNSTANGLRVSRNIKAWHDIARQLQNIKIKITSISERRTRYGVKGFDEGSSIKDAIGRSTDISTLHKEEDDIVGLKSDKEKLIKWLKDVAAEHKEISVCGMGGVGKTTLVAQIFKSKQIQQEFQWRAWVTVSKSYNKDNILREIIKQLFHEKKGEMVMQGIDGMDTRGLAEKLHVNLECYERCLIVLDDVWDVSLWHEIKDVFNTTKGRIIFTTRNIEIASSLASPADHVVNLNPLKYDEASKLFYSIAFRGDRDGKCPPELEDSARGIIDKCDGLPLAVVTLGSLLNTKHSVIEWNDTLKSLNWMLTNRPQLEKMSNILMLSFYDLPHYLKNCFLYCSAFPEDSFIKRKRIVRLWVAEGFIEERDEMTMEDIAEQYLNELVLRNLLCAEKRNNWERLKSFRMHDLVREMAISISKKQNFCMTVDEQRNSNVRRLSVSNVRRLSLQCTCQEELGKMPCLRSLLLFAKIGFSCTFNNKRLLRVLHLKNASIDSIPDAVGDLFNLRYLCLKCTKVKVLPRRLKMLQNLQTLDVSLTDVQEIPNWVTKLPKLRHVLIYKVDHQDNTLLGGSMKKKQKHAWDSKELQTLKAISSNSEIVRRVGGLAQLRKFVIVEVKPSHGAELCASIKKMTFLDFLEIRSTNGGEEPLELENLDPPPPFLETLVLMGRLKNGSLPSWFKCLKNLKKLTLSLSKLTENPLLLLQSLPNLVELHLSNNSYAGKVLIFQEKSFPSLKALELKELSELNQITIEKEAMQCLNYFNLVRCNELKALPEGIEHLTTLKELYMEEMPEELSESMQGGGDKISHIPKVEFWNRIDGKWRRCQMSYGRVCEEKERSLVTSH
ncbi:Disease resistance protein RPM1 [Acorus calamus]|uniref:Disease resistance protein RPM1 n=1 Tax=Acorus calamus TaxID=4465 RepID=A0AAV9D4J2_ACOCL|nr:Disease resistance protein RPM1 [Acorus calamus]